MTLLRSGSATDVGRVRAVNQDMPLERPNLFAVADGMGGHVGGEVAARVAVETLALAFEQTPTLEGLRDAITRANAAVWHESHVNSDLRGMGTTLTAMALVGGGVGRDMVALANVGDSRAYVYADGALVQVTDDHSLAEERMRLGEMTEAEAAVHPQRHILTRALGVAAEVEVDMWELGLRTGDRVLLCSDGLSNEVDLGEMAAILGQVADPHEAATRLVEVANEHGGADNITVVVVDVQVAEDRGGERVLVTALSAGSAASGVVGGVPSVHPSESSPATPSPATPSSGPTASSNAGPGTGGAAGVPTPRPDDTAVIRAVRPDDTLAPGARLGFGPEETVLAEVGPRSDEFFVGAGSSAPLSRSTTRVPPPPLPRSPESETRRERRRRLGIPHRVTFRVIGFLLLIAAVPVAAYFVLHWYAYDNWRVSLEGDQVVITQGQPGGVLWFNPKVVDRTACRASDVTPSARAALRSGVDKSSLHSAQDYIKQITGPNSCASPTTKRTTAGTAVTTTTAGSPAGPTTTVSSGP